MAQQRMNLWATEDIDEDLQDVDLSLAMNAYGNTTFDDGALHLTLVLHLEEKEFPSIWWSLE